MVEGKPLLSHDLRCKGMKQNAESNDLCEYVALVKWKRKTKRDEAKWKRKAGLYTPQAVRASLDGQPTTIEFLEQEFEIKLREIVA